MNKNIETEIKKIKNEVSCVKNDGNSIYYSNFKIFKSSSDKLQIKKNSTSKLIRIISINSFEQIQVVWNVD